MDFRVLGSLEVLDAGRSIPLGGPKQRLVLALLVVRRGDAVPADVLVGEVWGDEPPEAVRKALQAYVSRLRAGVGPERIEGGPGGYVLHAGPDEIDASRFERALIRARGLLDADPARAVETYRSALAMWRGPAFADLADEHALRGEIARLEELRASAAERMYAVELEIGRHSQIVAELEALTVRHPLRERLWAELMLSLYRTGRQGQALSAYRRARDVLAEELGVDPSEELQALHEQILRHDPAIAAPEVTSMARSMSPGPDLVDGSTFSGYRIERVLGRGGMSVVYLAQHMDLRRKVALKVLAPQLADDPRFRDRFVRESRIAASIDHPNVLPIYEAGEVDGRLFIAMRYVEGSDLGALLRGGSRLDVARTVRILRQVAAALDSAHAKGLVHRDVKPRNVLIARADPTQPIEHAYLADFGITRRAASDSGVTGTGQFVGTLDYAAPEQFEGKRLTPATDVYSLGCVLYQCLAGRPPFHRQNDAASVMYAHLLEDPPSLSRQRPDLPPGIDAVIARAMAKRPEDRYQSAGELAGAAASGLGFATGDGAAPARRGEIQARRRLFAAAAALSLVAAILVILLPMIGEDGGDRETFRPGTVLLDLETGQQVGFIPPSRLAVPAYPRFAGGNFWVNNFFPASYVEIDPSGKILREVNTPAIDPDVTGEGWSETYYVVDGGFLWITSGDDLVKVDIERNAEVQRFRLDVIVPGESGFAQGVAVGGGSVWVSRLVGAPGQIVRLDPDTGEIEKVFRDSCPHGNLAFADGSLWAADNCGILRIDAKTNAVTKTPDVDGNFRLAAGGGYGWTSDEAKGVVYQIDRTGRLVQTHETGFGAGHMAFQDGVLWVANSDVGTVTGIDAITGQTTTFRLGHPVSTIAVGDGIALVGVAPGRSPEDAIDALTGRVVKLFGTKNAITAGEPALDRGPAAFQIAYATCAKLLNYSDVPAPDGAQLQPEVAETMPSLSPDGRTYAFTIRSGFRFSPPENDAVTAETFRYSLERALSPELGDDAPGPDFIGDIEGEQAFLEGEADHISGLRVDGDRLWITLVEPSADFLERLALPFFCPVPTDTPFAPGALARGGEYLSPGLRIPSAGPYFVAAHHNEEYVILRRNPNYGGSRPQIFDAIALREAVDLSIAVGRLQDEDWDGILTVRDPLLAPDGPLAQRYTGGEAGFRYHSILQPNTEYVAFNAGRPLFSDPRVRRAAAFALDRSSLAASWSEVAVDDVLPPNMRGYEDLDVFANEPDLRRARALMGDRGGTAIMPVAADCEECRQFAESVRASLSRIGIDVEFVEMDANDYGAGDWRDGAYDLADWWTFQDHADPASFLSKMLGDDVPNRWLPASVRDGIAELSRLEGEARIAAAQELARRIQSVEVPIAAIGNYPIGELLSDGLGCQVFPPFGYGVDLAALCPVGDE